MRRFVIIVFLCGLFITRSVYASAQNMTYMSGITVSPAIEQLRLTTGQTAAGFPVTLTNNMKYPVQLKLGFNDFKSLNNSGGIAFLGTHPSDVEAQHGLAKWIDLNTQQIGLDAGQTEQVHIQMHDLQTLAPGGHYGAITYQVLKVDDGTGNHVAINQVLTSLIFLITAGGGTQTISLDTPQVSDLYYRMPTQLALTFTNTGNTQTAPRGWLTIDQGTGTPVRASGIINSGSALILPGSARLLLTPLQEHTRPWWPGRYFLHIHYRTDGAAQFETFNTSFFYFNPLLPLLGIGIIVMISLIARWLYRHPTVVKRTQQNIKLLLSRSYSLAHRLTLLASKVISLALGAIIKAVKTGGRAFSRIVVEVVLANIAYLLVAIGDALRGRRSH